MSTQRVVADCTTGDLPDISQANARLIAAAPELLESLKLCVAKLQILLDEVSAVNGHGFPDVEKIEKDAYAAIAKAEGH